MWDKTRKKDNIRFVRNQVTTVDAWGLITQGTLGSSAGHALQLSLQRGEAAGYLSMNSHQSSADRTLDGVKVLTFLPCPALGWNRHYWAERA